MGAIGGLLGTAGGAAGSGFSTPQQASIVNPTNAGQISSAYTGVQNSQQAQQNLLSALQGQNGLGNQSQVYGQLQGVANGTGPNPAQAMLNQATGQNVANQAALMAGQRGAGSNVGLMARQAAQQGANIQQQAVGQGATMQANQSLNAISAAGNMANTQAGQQIGQTNANTAAQQAEQAALINAQLGVNNSNVGMQSNVNNVNGQLANTTMQGQQGLIGGVMNSLGGGISSLAEGGDVDDGGGDSQQLAPADDSGDFDTDKESVQPGNVPNDSTPSFGSDAGASALAKGFGSFAPNLGGLMGGGGGGGDSGGGGGGMGGIMSLVAMMAKGGEPRRMMAMAGDVGEMADEPTIDAAPSAQPQQPQAIQGPQPQSKFGKFMKGAVKGGKAPSGAAPQYGGGAQALYEGMSSIGEGIAKQIKGSPSSSTTTTGTAAPWDSGAGTGTLAGGPGDSMDNSGGSDLMGGPDVMNAAKGGMTHDYRSGGKVKAKKAGQKAVAKGDNYANDKIPAVLSEHEIVLPRSVTLGKNPERDAAAFVRAVLAKRKMKR